MACNDLNGKHILVGETKVSFLRVCSCDRNSYTGTYCLLSEPLLALVHTVYIYFWGGGVSFILNRDIVACTQRRAKPVGMVFNPYPANVDNMASSNQC